MTDTQPFPDQGDRGPREATSPPEDLLNAALRLLAARRRGVEELRGRLLRKGFPTGDVANCLRWLEVRDLLDDGAFARAWIRDRLNLSPRGPYLILQELIKRGVRRSLAQEALEEVLEEEAVSEDTLAEAAARGWVRKQGPRVLKALTGERFSEDREKARRRLYAFLARQGFRGEGARRGMEAGEVEARNDLSNKD